jgi:hypothetical protein
MSDIIPTEKTTTKVVVRFAMDIIDLVLNTSATFRVITYDIEGSSIDTTSVLLAGEDYTNWGTNDDYVIQFVATQLGFTLV